MHWSVPPSTWEPLYIGLLYHGFKYNIFVAQLDTRPTGDQEVTVWPQPGQQHSFMEI